MLDAADNPAGSIVAAHDIVATFERPSGFDTSVTLAGRVRGAIWAALQAGAPGRRAQFRRKIFPDLAQAEALLFSDPPHMPPRNTSLPFAPSRPYLVFTSTREDIVTVTLRLFGRARYLEPELKQAMRYALCNLGIAVAPLARARAKIGEEDVKICVRVPELPGLPALAGAVRLIFMSPVRLASRKHFAITTRNLVSSATSRVLGLAAWSDMSPVISPEAFERAQRDLVMSDYDMQLIPSHSYSSRQNRRTLFVGSTGALTLSSIEPEFRDLLAATQLTGLGLHTTRGFGQVTMCLG